MILSNLSKFTNETIDKFINKNSNVIDATSGNGNDTLSIIRKIPNGHLFAFDIQKTAIKNTKLKCTEYENITYINDDHSKLNHYVKKNVDLVIYNLGYLPNFNSLITTKSTTTIQSIDQAIKLLNKNGGIIITIYTKHDNHLEEENLIKYIKTLSKYEYNILKYQFQNLTDAPYLLIIEKKYYFQ